MTELKQTPSQTVGPYFAYGLAPQQYGYGSVLRAIATGDMATAEVPGDRIRVEGCVFDGEGKTVADAMMEIWQADSLGRYAHPADPRGSNAAFTGFGRFGTGTDTEHRFIFDTIRPGAVDALQAPHINVIVFMRGMLVHMYTRIYFSDEAARNATDPVLNAVPIERRSTLIAERCQTSGGIVYRFDVHMQGSQETVFFDA